MKKWFSIICLIAMMGFMLFAVRVDAVNTLFPNREEAEMSEIAEIADAIVSDEQAEKNEGSLKLWYTDDALTEFVSRAALSFQADTGVRVTPTLVSGVQFLEQINQASVYEGESKADSDEVYVAPDLYITTHDNLMKAHYSGLADAVEDFDQVLIPYNYPQTALRAVSCNNQYVAYPLYYETNFFLYNKTYMANMAKEKIENEEDRAEGLAAEAAIDEEKLNAESRKEAEEAKKAEEGKIAEETKQAENSESTSEGEKSEEELLEGDLTSDEDIPMGEEDVETDPAVLERLATMIPSTIDDIQTFANNYDAPEKVEAVFKWDVSDIFYNYFFIGNYVNVGGENGDDNTIFNIYNQQAVDCLTVYQGLNNFFSIDANDVSYDSILNEFMDGKTVFTVATTDAVAKIEEKKKAGEFEYDYGVAVLPDISSLLKARGLSVTSAVAINGYSKNKELANEFAKYLTYDKASELYKMSGKISCRKTIDNDNEEIANIMAEYEKSVSLPKMIEASNYWVQLEIAFTKVWTGEDPDTVLRALSDTIGGQISELDYHIPTQESVGAGAGM